MNLEATGGSALAEFYEEENGEEGAVEGGGETI